MLRHLILKSSHRFNSILILEFFNIKLFGNIGTEYIFHIIIVSLFKCYCMGTICLLTKLCKCLKSIINSHQICEMSQNCNIF